MNYQNTNSIYTSYHTRSCINFVHQSHSSHRQTHHPPCQLGSRMHATICHIHCTVSTKLCLSSQCYPLYGKSHSVWLLHVQVSDGTAAFLLLWVLPIAFVSSAFSLLNENATAFQSLHSKRLWCHTFQICGNSSSTISQVLMMGSEVHIGVHKTSYFFFLLPLSMQEKPTNSQSLSRPSQCSCCDYFADER